MLIIISKLRFEDHWTVCDSKCSDASSAANIPDN